MLKLVSHIDFARLTTETNSDKIIVYNSKNYKINLSVNFVCDIKITRNWENLTQTAQIEIPNTYRGVNKFVVENIKKGDLIQIFLGYLEDGINKSGQPSLTKRFIGYVTVISPGYIIKLECEDEMWNLKRTILSPQYLTANSLKELISSLQSQTKTSFPINISDTSELGTFVIPPASTFADVLDVVKQKYLILCYFKFGILQMTKVQQFVNSNEHTFIVQRNIIGIDSLKWQTFDDVRLLIKGDSVITNEDQADGHIMVYVYYKPDSTIAVLRKEGNSEFYAPAGYNQITVNVQNKTETELIQICTDMLKQRTYTGYKGGFETFGEPQTEIGDHDIFKDARFTERTYVNGIVGKYLQRSVLEEFGHNGYKQKIEIYGLWY